MRIIFFTQEDPFYVKLFFDEFFDHFKYLDEVKAVVISKPMGKKSLIGLAKQMYGLYGPLNFVKIGIKYVFYKIMSKRSISESLKTSGRRCLQKTEADDRKRFKTYSVKQTVEAKGIEVIERSDLNSEGFRGLLSEYDTDLFISVASPIIFKEGLIKIPRMCAINIHNAPLPKYRGMLPNFWQLFHKEKFAGITIHVIDSGIDTGDIVSQKSLAILEGESLDELISRTKREGAHMMIDMINRYREKKVVYRKMDGEGSYFTFPKRKDVKQFKKYGGRLF